MVEAIPCEVIQHDVFREWLISLRDAGAKARIAVRIRRLELGNAGDFKALGDGVSEIRIDYGPGYRVYYRKNGRTVVILLCGGDKTTQAQDIERAKTMARNLG
jgi:putative addiction module killer protein